MAPIPKRLPPPVAFLVGAVLFAALSTGTHAGARTAGLEGMASSQVILKSIMLVVSLGLMWLIGRPPRVWGFGAPRSWLTSTLGPIVVGGVLGAAASAVILGCGFPPMAGVREMGLLQIIPILWFGSTIAEEVFVRGLIQGWMQPIEPGDGAPERRGSTARIVASGLLFGSMHVSLFFVGNDARTVVTIVAATTLLGLTCAWSRERSGSLAGPLLSHFAFNACGIIGGIAVFVIRHLIGS